VGTGLIGLALLALSLLVTCKRAFLEPFGGGDLVPARLLLPVLVGPDASREHLRGIRR
jgi:hypothetical protein